MTNNVNLNAISVADLINGFSAFLYSAVDSYMSTKLPAQGNTSHTVEKPMTMEELCEFVQMSEPILSQLAQDGTIPRYKFPKVKGYRYFASEVVASLKGQNQLK